MVWVAQLTVATVIGLQWPILAAIESGKGPPLGGRVGLRIGFAKPDTLQARKKQQNQMAEATEVRIIIR